jgi:hypothetical protein
VNKLFESHSDVMQITKPSIRTPGGLLLQIIQANCTCPEVRAVKGGAKASRTNGFAAFEVVLPNWDRDHFMMPSSVSIKA